MAPAPATPRRPRTHQGWIVTVSAFEADQPCSGHGAGPGASTNAYWFTNCNPASVGCAGIGIDPKLSAAVKSADLLVVVGARMGEMTTSGYTLIDIPNPRQTFVHVHPSGDELGSVYRPDLPIVSGAAGFASSFLPEALSCSSANC